MKKKNLLLLVNQLYGGGAQKVVANLSIHLSEFYNITLAIYNDVDKVVFPYQGELIKLDLPYPEDTHNNPFLKRMVRFISLVKKVRRLKKKLHIDVTISFLEASNFVNVLSASGDKTILSVRSYLSHEMRDIPRLKIFRTLIRILYNRANQIVVPSQLLMNDLVRNFKVSEKKVSVIYNFIDQELISQLGKEPLPAHLASLFSNYPVIMNVGRITNPKAQWLLMPVLAKVKNQIPEAKLVILGEGPLIEKILQYAEKEHLRVYQEGISTHDALTNNDIFLLGFTKNPFPYLNSSQLFIKSSVYEGFPNVIIEAMTGGLPIISSDCASGPREILSPSTSILSNATKNEYAEYGILTPVGDGDEAHQQHYISEATEAIITLLTDTTKRTFYKNQSLKRVNSYNRKKIIDEWLALIN